MTEKKIVFNCSPSAKGLYNDSQIRFFYSYIEKLPPDTKVVESYGAGGQVVHYVLEEYAKNRNIDFEQLFISKWAAWPRHDGSLIDLNTAYTLSKGGRPLNRNVYLQAVHRGVRKINSNLKEGVQFKTEEKIEFPLIDNEKALINVKGYIDLQVIEPDGSITIIDWKTSSKVDDDSPNFRNQLLHYAYSIWKKHGVFAKKFVCEYIKIDASKPYSFTEEEIMGYEKVIKDFVDEVLEKGFDISKYEMGDWDNTPFNAHKKACTFEYHRRLNPVEKKDDVVVFTIVKHGHKCILQGPITQLLLQGLIRNLSYEENNEYVIKETNRKRNGNWDGFYRMYNVHENSFPSGLLTMVKSTLNEYAVHKKIYIKLRYDDKRRQVNIIKMPDKLNIESLRPKQIEAADLSEKVESGIFSLATGTGKTIMSAEIVRRHAMKTLFIVHRIKLFKQTVKAYENVLGIKCGKLQGDNKEFGNVTIATWETINKMLDKNNPMQRMCMLNFLATIDLVIWDECHVVAPQKILDISDALINCKKRFGLSATPRRLDGHDLKMKGVCGDIIMMYQKEAIDDGTLMKPTIVFLYYDHKNSRPKKKEDRRKKDRTMLALQDYREDYEFFVMNNTLRDEEIGKIVNMFKGKKVLVLAQRIPHVEKLAIMLQCPCITSHTSAKDRTLIEEEFEDCTEGVLVTTGQIFGTGVDIPNIDRIVNVSANKNENEILQKLGRGLRKAKDKEDIIFVDIYDRGVRSLENAARIRANEFREFGHKINFIKSLEVEENE